MEVQRRRLFPFAAAADSSPSHSTAHHAVRRALQGLPCCEHAVRAPFALSPTVRARLLADEAASGEEASPRDVDLDKN